MSMRRGNEAQDETVNCKGQKARGKEQGSHLSFALLVLLSALRAWAQGSSATTLPSWTVPMTITLGGGGQDAVKFGTKAGATDDLDQGTDVLSPPPPPNSFDAYFEITHPFFPQLSEDYRSDQDSTIVWKFVISATGGSAGTIRWDMSAFPGGDFSRAVLQIKQGETILANMRSPSSLDFTGDQSLEIMFNLPPPPPPKKGCCGQAAASVAGLNPTAQPAIEAAINIVFFLVPIILLRRKKSSNQNREVAP